MLIFIPTCEFVFFSLAWFRTETFLVKRDALTLWRHGVTLLVRRFYPGSFLFSGFIDLVLGLLIDLDKTWCLFYSICIPVMLVTASLFRDAPLTSPRCFSEVVTSRPTLSLFW